MSNPQPPAELLGALVRLRQTLVDNPVRLPEAEVDYASAAAEQTELIHQLDDYVIPRMVQTDAPLLAVVGGSTGAGKSTLVNSLAGAQVSPTGVIRPTTRSPVLVHNPADAEWFGPDRLLPDLERTEQAHGDQAELQLAPMETLPAGVAILDAPDIDSVEARNRALASQLLSAADLWLFVTSAARYADQVPWDFLKIAVERSTAVAVILDRVRPDAVGEVSGHLQRMLETRGLQDARLFCVEESTVEEGMLPGSAVGSVREWLGSLAADAAARAEVVRKTLDGAVASLPRRTRQVSEVLADQREVLAELRRNVTSAYDEALTAVDDATSDGTMLRGEVLARWQEFIGTGDIFKTLQERVGGIRDRIFRAVRGHPQPEKRLQVAVESGLQTVIVEHAEAAAERASTDWRTVPTGRLLLAEAPADIGRASRGLRDDVERSIRDWQGAVLELVRTEGAGRRSTARFLAYGVNGLGVALMMVIFVQTAGLTGAEFGVAGGTAVVAQKILEAVFGDQAVRRLVRHAREDLHRRVAHLWSVEQQRYLDVLEAHPLDRTAPDQLLDLAREIENIRLARDLT